MQAQGKMKALNEAIRSAIPAMQRVSRDYPEAVVYVNAIRFGDEARWLAERLIPVSEFRWRQDMEAGGLTALGEALEMVGEALQPPLISGRALPPILLLVTDGLPTDDFQAGLNHLLEKPWGKRSVRFAVALGEDGARPEAQEFLRAFISSDAPPPLRAENAEVLAGVLRWAAIVALKSVCAPPTRRFEQEINPVVMPEPVAAGGARDGW